MTEPGVKETGGDVFNTDHIQTTHVGSLPRPAEIAEGLFARERGEYFDPAAFRACLASTGTARGSRRRTWPTTPAI